MIKRYKTPLVQIGKVVMGGKSPIMIQSMTDTDTADITATSKQILQLAKAGSEIVRITIDRPASAEAVPEIIKMVRQESEVPIVGDFHFNGHILLRKYPEMARVIDKYRINPGNVGRGEKHDPQFQEICEIAVKNKKPVRIGVNGGSLDDQVLQIMMDENASLNSPLLRGAGGVKFSNKNNPLNPPSERDFIKTDQQVFVDAMVESALQSIELAQKCGLQKNQIIVSVKTSEVHSMITAYQELASKTDVCLHLGLTEAGGGTQGIVNSSIALGQLLLQGIGDTIRVSVTPQSGQSRTHEVTVAKEILQALNLRQFKPKITSCPGCGRTSGNQFAEFAEAIEHKISSKIPEWQEQYPKAKNLKIAVMGCVVNGPGEARHADIGLFFPGQGEGKLAIVYQDGVQIAELKTDNVEREFFELVEEYLRLKR